MTLSDLISKLEGVTGGCRELDAWIWWQMLPDRDRRKTTAVLRKQIEAGDIIRFMQSQFYNWPSTPDIPFFTTSADAALTLIPAGYDASIEIYGSGGADVVVLASVGNERGTGWIKQKTVPLALCIASLRTRQSLEIG